MELEEKILHSTNTKMDYVTVNNQIKDHNEPYTLMFEILEVYNTFRLFFL